MAKEGSEEKATQAASAEQPENGSFFIDLMIFFGTIFFVATSVCLLPELEYSILGAAFAGVGAICFSIGIYFGTTIEDFSKWLAKCSKAERIGILILGFIIASAFLASSGLVTSSLANADIGVFTAFLGANNLGAIPAMAIGVAALVYAVAIIAISWVAYSRAEGIIKKAESTNQTTEEDDDSEYEDEESTSNSVASQLVLGNTASAPLPSTSISETKKTENKEKDQASYPLTGPHIF